MSQQRQMEYIRLEELERLSLRDIRIHVVDDIAERIEQDNYNPSRPLRVVPDGDNYKVIDGNHRVKALQGLDSVESTKPVPCVVEPEDCDVHKLAHKSNKDEDTYAQEDLFDHLDYIEGLREDHTQKEIADKLGWSEAKVKQYSALLKNTVTDVLEKARSHEKGRVTGDVTSVTFTEGWFRTSNLYDLQRDGVTEYATSGEEQPKHAQVRVMEWFCESQNCDATKNAVQNKVAEVQEKCELLDILEKRLEAGVSDEKRAELRQQVIEGVYTKDTINSPIENANKDAKDRAIFGKDALDVLPTLEGDSVDCVVTDPPYGVDYSSIRPSDNPEFDDTEKNAFDVIDSALEEMKRVCKANAHIYIFFSMSEYEKVVDMASKHFEVEKTPLIWAKHNHAPSAPGSNGFEKGYAQKYEPVLFCKMPNGDERTLNGGVSPNVLKHQRPSGDGRTHDTQKPRSLLKELIKNSTGKGERVLDPFAGSGSTLLSAKELSRHYVGVELDGSYESGFQRAIKEVEHNE